jgi:hypothetical protein
MWNAMMRVRGLDDLKTNALANQTGSAKDITEMIKKKEDADKKEADRKARVRRCDSSNHSIHTLVIVFLESRRLFDFDRRR